MKNQKVSSSAQGVDEFSGPEEVPDLANSLTREQVHEFLKKDLQVAINCLDAIYRDQDLLNAMTDFMFGRFKNAKHKEALNGKGKV